MAHSATAIEHGSDTGRSDVVVSISVRTLLVAAGIVAVAGALASIGSALLMIFVSVLCVAVLSPVATAMERRLGWSRALCSTVLVLGIVIALAVVLLVLAQAVSDAVGGFSHDLPEIVDRVRHSDVGDFINGGSGSLDTLREHATDITKGVATVSGGVADVGVSAFGAITLFFSVIFLTLFGLNDEPRVRDWIGGLMYRDTRERYLDVTDRIIHTTSRYMLGNLAISVICATVYGVTAVILDLPYPLALALIAGFLDLIPTVGATIAGVIIGVVALSVSLQALVAFAIVMLVYQQVENYVLQPTIIGRAARVSGFTVLVSVLAFGALFGFIGAIIGVPIAAALQILVGGAHGRPGGLASRPPTSLSSSSRPDRPQSRKACDDGSRMCGRSIGRDNNHTLEVIVSEHAATPQFAAPSIPSLRDSVRNATGYWWVLLAAGIAWVAVALVILQFDQASVTTVGILVGLMFLALGVENIALSTLDVPVRWAWALFGGLFSCPPSSASPTRRTPSPAWPTSLGFLFLIVGVWWMIRAFLERAINPLWWLGLISGILMTALAFWTSGQFFIHKAYVLLVFAGIWALMQGITNIVRAFQIRALREEL